MIPGLLAAAAILFAVRQAPRLKERKRTAIRLAFRPVLRGALGRLFIGISAFEMGNIATTLLILRATQALTPAYGQDVATEMALGMYVAYNVAATLVSVPAGHVSDRRGPVLVLAVGALLFCAADFGFAIASLPFLAVGFVLAGIAIGCIETAQHAAVASLAPPDIRGSAFGVLAAAQSFGNFASSAMAGLLWTFVSPFAAFLYLAFWMLVGAGVTVRHGPEPTNWHLQTKARLSAETPLHVPARRHDAAHLAAEFLLERRPPRHELEAEPVIDHGEPAGGERHPLPIDARDAARLPPRADGRVPSRPRVSPPRPPVPVAAGSRGDRGRRSTRWPCRRASPSSAR